MAELKVNVSDDLEKELQIMIYKTIQEVFEESLRKDLHAKDYLSFDEVCSYVSISKGTLLKWINTMGLKKITIGGRNFISKKSLIEFMKSFEK